MSPNSGFPNPFLCYQPNKDQGVEIAQRLYGMQLSEQVDVNQLSFEVIAFSLELFL